MSKLMVERAMLLLPDVTGTANEVCEQVMALATRESKELDCTLSPGQCRMTRWEQTVNGILTQRTYSYLFHKLPDKRHTGKKPAVVYQYTAPVLSNEQSQRLVSPYDYVKCQTPNVGGPKQLSNRRKGEQCAGGDRRHGD